MAKYGRPIAAPDGEPEIESKQPKSSPVPFRRRWSAGFEILFFSVFVFQAVYSFSKFLIWARDAINFTEGASVVLRYGGALVAFIAAVFLSICIPLLIYEMACWVILWPWNKERILQSLQSDRRAWDESEIKPE